MSWQEEVVSILLTFSHHSGLFGQAEINFREEHRLPNRFWGQLRRVLDACRSTTDLRNQITTHCRGWILKGPMVSRGRGLTLGRAVGMDALSQLWVELGYFSDRTEAESFIRSLQRKPRHVVSRRCKNYLIGRYVMWATFELTGGRPFQAFTSADEVRCRLGLSEDARGDNLVLLEYVPPKSLAVRVPTVADAYSGEWFFHFRPTDHHHPHGWSMPWAECQNEPRAPEVVHEPVSGANLNCVTELLS